MQRPLNQASFFFPQAIPRPLALTQQRAATAAGHRRNRPAATKGQEEGDRPAVQPQDSPEKSLVKSLSSSLGPGLFLSSKAVEQVLLLPPYLSWCYSLCYSTCFNICLSLYLYLR